MSTFVLASYAMVFLVMACWVLWPSIPRRQARTTVVVVPAEVERMAYAQAVRDWGVPCSRCRRHYR